MLQGSTLDIGTVANGATSRVTVDGGSFSFNIINVGGRSLCRMTLKDASTSGISALDFTVGSASNGGLSEAGDGGEFTLNPSRIALSHVDSVVEFNQTNAYTYSGSGGITGAGSLKATGSGVLTLNQTTSYSGTTTIDAGSTLILGALSSGLFNSTIVNNGALTIGNGNGGTYSKGISGSGNITWAGSSTTHTMAGDAKTYTGLTTINSGITLNLTIASGLGADGGGAAGSGTEVANGAAVHLSGGIAVGQESLSIIGTGRALNGALLSETGANSFAGAITLAGNASIGASSGSTLALTGGIALGGNTLTLRGNGSITETASFPATAGW